MYTPQLLPSKKEDMDAFLSDEFNRIAASYNDLQDGIMGVDYNLPERVKPGMVKVFDGTKANPTGNGLNTLYYYALDNQWHGLAPIDLLGTSATADTVTSPADQTAGRVLVVGYAGIGSELLSPVVDLNGYTIGGKYVTPLGTINRPDLFPDVRYTVEVVGGPTAFTQTITGAGGFSAIRHYNGSSFEPWFNIFTQANVDLVPWQPIVFQNGWSDLGGAYQSRFRRCVGGVDLVVSANSGTLTAGTTIATLPVSHRPIAICTFPVFTSDIAGLSQLPRMEVHPDGAIKIFGFPSGATISGFTGRVPI